ncbi:MAG: NAD(P)/FAD-dependent oxidoreductase [Candidatus Helarchaeota archaeon]
MDSYDLIIVGGGPAGSMAGYYAAQSGLKVLILERSEKPGQKTVSGCGLSPKLWRDFSFMDEIFELPHRIADMATIHFIDENNKERSNISFTPSDQANYDAARKFLTVNIYRGIFDEWLMKYATQEGAVLKTSTCVTDLIRDEKNNPCGVVTDKGEKFQAPIILGCEGVISVVAQKTGLHERWDPSESCWMVNYDFVSTKERIDEIIGGNALHYFYAGSFPTGYTFFNVDGFHFGLGSFFDHVKNKDWSPKNLLKKLYEVETVKRQIKLCNGKPREYQAHILPMIEDPNKTCKKTYANNVLLLGDAAGFLCPFEAEGVYYAMLSGKIAVDIVKKAHDTGDFSENVLSSYEDEWRNSPIGEEFVLGPAFSKIVHGLFFNPKPTAHFVELTNDLLFGLANVAESHHYNLNHIEGLLEKHFPFIRNVLDEYGGGFTSALTKKPPIDIISILKAYLDTQIKKIKKREKND